MITPSFGLTATERVLPRLALDWTTGSAQSGVDVTRAGVATFIGSNGLVQSATADTQRIDYSTGTAGLLVEESRANLCLYSEDLRNTAEAGVTRPWAHNNASITYQPVGISSPDGNENVCTLVENTATSAHFTFQVITSTAANFTYSIFAKDAGRRYLRMSVADIGFTSGSRAYATFDLQTGDSAIGGVTASNLATKVETLSDGWYKCSVTATITAGTQMLIGLFLSNVFAAVSALPSYEGDGVSGIHLYGSDNQVGLFPTSYIPTTTAAVTRNADVATMTGTNFSDWFNASEGTLLLEAESDVVGSFLRVLSLSNNTAAEEIYFTRNAGIARAIAVSSSSTQASFIFSAWDGSKRVVMGYKADDFAGAFNGSATQTDTSGTVPTINRMNIGQRYNNTGSIGLAHVRKILYWPHRLTNAEIQAFSK
jgi:hypothetical protein